jgi:uncharacterized coiled-coil protein SlyX
MEERIEECILTIQELSRLINFHKMNIKNLQREIRQLRDKIDQEETGYV